VNEIRVTIASFTFLSGSGCSSSFPATLPTPCTFTARTSATHCGWPPFLRYAPGAALAGRLPGVEPKPYVTHYGMDQPNLPYRVVCYTAAWIGILVPFSLNFIGLVVAALSGRYIMAELYQRLYYPLALAVVLATWLDWTPRARRSTVNEGAEKAWFYVASGRWCLLRSQSGGLAAGRNSRMDAPTLGLFRFLVFVVVAGLFFVLGLKGRLPRTARVHLSEITRAETEATTAGS